MLSSSNFFQTCLINSAIAVAYGAFMMFYEFTGLELVQGQGSTPADPLFKQTSSFVGFLLFAIGVLLFMVAFVKDRAFQDVLFFMWQLASGSYMLRDDQSFWPEAGLAF